MNHLQQYLVDEFVEDYQEGHLTRREALKRIAGITGMAVAIQLLAACGQPAASGAPTAPATSAPATPAPTEAPASPTEAPAAIATTSAEAPTAAPTTAAPTTAAPTTAAGSVPNSVPEGDPSVVAERVTFPGSGATLMAYVARPAGDGAAPIMLICHENRGLTPHIEDVARRAAKAGYVGVAVDLLSREGGTSKVADQASIPGLLSGAPPERHVQDFTAGLAYAKAQPYAQGDRAGMIGFCFGGGVTWLCAAGIPELRAAVPFYGPPPPANQYERINAAVLAIYAGNDQRITSTAEAAEAAMKQAGKTYQKVVYPGVDHAFNNDTGSRYNAEAAQAAWAETLTWFQQYVKG